MTTALLLLSLLLPAPSHAGGRAPRCCPPDRRGLPIRCQCADECGCNPLCYCQVLPRCKPQCTCGPDGDTQ